MFIHQAVIIYSQKRLFYYFKEEVARGGYKFDVVTSLEVIEHVQDKRFFVDQLAQLTKVIIMKSLEK